MSTDLVAVPVPGTDRQIMATVIDGVPMVSLRHCCEAIGLATDSQRRKLRSRVWNRHYATKVADSALFVIDGGAS